MPEDIEVTQEPVNLTTTKATAPGYQTSEFWQSIIGSLAGLGVIVFGIVYKNAEVMWAGVALTGATSASYSISRGLAKQG